MAKGTKEATFHARQSGRVAATSITTDHDIWVERLAVVDMLVPNAYTRTGQAKYELQIRSFFESQLSGQKCWDEPPSGAESIQYANDEMRRMAEMQKNDLEGVNISQSNDDYSGDDHNHVSNRNSNNNLGNNGRGRKLFGTKMKNLFHRRRREKNNDQDSAIGRGMRGVTIKEDSLISEFLNESKDGDYNPNRNNFEYAIAQSLNDSSNNDNNNDLSNHMIDTRSDLERALALSVTESNGNDFSKSHDEEEEEIALATALSLSLNEMSQSPNTDEGQNHIHENETENLFNLTDENTQTRTSIGQEIQPSPITVGNDVSSSFGNYSPSTLEQNNLARQESNAEIL